MYMSKPFYERLVGYYEDVGKVLRGQASAAGIFANPSDLGTAREVLYAQFLEHHLPAGCQVMRGGFLYGMDGSESKQIDIIVTNDAPLRFNMFKQELGNKAFSCVDGCLAAVSVKSDMDSGKLRESLQNLASIPQVSPPNNASLPPDDYEFWPLKLAFAQKGSSLSTLANTLKEFYMAQTEIPNSRKIDIVHVSGVGCLMRGGIGVMPGGHLDYTAIPDVTDVGALSVTVQNIQLYHLRSRRMYFYYGHMLDHILAQYRPK